MRTITFSGDEYFTVSKLLSSLEEEFEIGYSKDIGDKTIEIQCHDDDYDVLISRVIKKDKSPKNNPSSRANSEAVKNSLGLNVIIPKNTSSVNNDRLKRISSLMARTQRI